MKLLIIILSLFIAVNCYAQTLWRYTDKATGDEMGICYSEKPTDNPSWNSQIIKEDQKDQYIQLKESQNKAKQEAVKDDKNKKAKKCADKLKGLGLDKDDIELILGEGYSN